MRIVIADDDRVSRTMLHDNLEKWGHEVVCTSDGAEAWSALQAQDAPCLAIIDWMMPEMDGLEVCRRVRSRAEPYVYLILLTAKHEREDILEGMRAGADDYVAKPFDSQELRVRIRAAERLLDLHSELLDAREALEYQATHDSLTALPNRGYFMEQFNVEWTRSERHRNPLSCAILDIDFFKRINDTHGHANGDVALKAVAGVLERERRATDLVCRFGGEEFCVLLPETDEFDATTWADRTRMAIAQMKMQIGSETIPLSVSIGVAQRLEDVESPDELLDFADQALLAAKESGRNRVLRYSDLTASGALDGAAAGRKDARLKGCLARDVMVAPVACLHQDVNAAAAADFFTQYRLNSAPVIDDEGHLVGIVSEKDLLSQATDRQVWNTPICDHLNTSVVSFDEHTPAQTIYDFLNRVSIRRVIIRQGRRPTGVISRGSLLRWLRNRRVADAPEAPETGERENRDPAPDMREGLLGSAESLSQCAQSLRQHIAEDDELTTAVVGEVTRIQELATDLLARCGERAARIG